MRKLLLSLLSILCSVATFADTKYTVSLDGSATESTAGYFTFTEAGYHTRYTGTYNSVSYTSGFKFSNSSSIDFTTKASTSSIIIVQSISANDTRTVTLTGATSGTITLTSADYTDATNTENYNVRIYEASGLTADTYTIGKTGGSELGLLYIEIAESGESTEGGTTEGGTEEGGETGGTEEGGETGGTEEGGDTGDTSTETTTTLASVSEATTWDFTAFTETATLTGETTPAWNTEFVFSELVSNGLINTLPSGFNADAIAMSTSASASATNFGVIRSSGGTYFSQARTWKINAAVAGTLTVVFSDTGSSTADRANRYLTVNGEQTEFYSNTSSADSETGRVTATVEVEASEIVLSGYTSAEADIRIYSIVFTPSETTQTEEPTETATLTGAWSQAAISVTAGSTITAPTFTVTASDETEVTEGTDYTVTYAIGETPYETIAAAIAAVDTETAGETTIVATLAAVDATAYAVETTTYNCVVTVTAATTEGGDTGTTTSGLQSVSETTTWDFTAFTETATLTGETTPAWNTEFVFSELVSNGLINTLPSGFNADAIAMSTSASASATNFGVIRSSGGTYFSQARTWKINAAVAGTLTVVFSDTGSSTADRANRYLTVNGEQTEFYSNTSSADSETGRVTATVEVEASEIVLSGYTSAEADIRIYSIVFTPSETTQTEEPTETATLTGAWSQAAISVTAGSTITAPTFTVTASDETEVTEGTDYTVTYAIGETPYETIAAAIAAVDTETAGETTIVATLAAVDATAYAVETTTYNCVVTVTAATTEGGDTGTTTSGLQSVSETTTWDFTAFTETATLTGETTPAWNTEFIFSELVDGGLITTAGIPSGFNADAIAMSTNASSSATNFGVIRSNSSGTSYYSQARTWKINTTVAGTLTVKFSDTGSSTGRDNRYLTVNGEQTEYYSNTSSADSETGQVTATVEVEAGEIVLSGYTTAEADIRIYSIVFTPSGTADRISAVESAATGANDAIYNLSGQRVSSSYKGVVIINGKKYIK